MLCRNARHSWEAGNPLVELARSVSEGPVSLGRANHGGCSRRLACRLGFRKARGQMCGPGVPSLSASDVLKFPMGWRQSSPGPQNQGDGPVEMIHFGRSLFLRQSVESG